jgi:hypothetical protein
MSHSCGGILDLRARRVGGGRVSEAGAEIDWELGSCKQSQARRNAPGTITSDLDNVGGQKTNTFELPRQTSMPNSHPPVVLWEEATPGDFRDCQQDVKIRSGAA